MNQLPILQALITEFHGQIVETERKEPSVHYKIRQELISRLQTAWQSTLDEDSTRWPEPLLSLCERTGRELGYTVQATYCGVMQGREWLPDVVRWKQNPWPENVEAESKWQVWEETLTHGGMVFACSCALESDREGLQEAVRKMTHSVNVPCLLIVSKDSATHDVSGDMNPRIQILRLQTS
jgi:hypothetical protein